MIADMVRRATGRIRRFAMVDLLLVVEAFLDGEGLCHHRDDANRLCFDFPFGRTSYDCRVHQAGQVLVLNAMWSARVAADEIERAGRVLVRLSRTGNRSGDTRFSPTSGRLKYTTSVDVSMSTLTVERVGTILETLLDPFNVKILAMELVLDGQLPEDAAVDIYEEWDRDRIAALMRPLLEGGGPDPSLN
ncbi:MAG: hypothetical protein ACREIT_02565 [Tepidisphaeraceae bacterium]